VDSTKRFRRAATLTVFILVATSTSWAGEVDIDGFVAQEPSVVFGSISGPGGSVAFLTHETSLEWPGVVFGDVILVLVQDEHAIAAAHLGRLSSSHVPGFAGETEFVVGMLSIDRSGTELCYLDFQHRDFRAFPVPARFIGAIVVWGDVIFYSTEHFEDNLHYVDIDDGEVHMVEGSGTTAMNSDFWIVDGELIVTDGGDKGTPYRLDTHGLSPAPDVTVSPETKVGFNLRTIRDGEGLERFEELLGIRSGE
jgi:hypothetical protein